MYCLNVRLKVNDPADVPAVREWLTQAGRLSRQEPGCLRFDVYHSETDKTQFLLCEHWADKSCLDVHRTGKAYTEIYQPQVIPRVHREAHVAALLE